MESPVQTWIGLWITWLPSFGKGLKMWPVFLKIIKILWDRSDLIFKKLVLFIKQSVLFIKNSV
jgi:hypothetical protein